MIPAELEEWIFPEMADETEDAAVLRHDGAVKKLLHGLSLKGLLSHDLNG